MQQGMYTPKGTVINQCPLSINSVVRCLSRGVLFSSCFKLTTTEKKKKTQQNAVFLFHYYLLLVITNISKDC